ncbi:hypothetical protein IEQ34_018550 [Dendrobium chrysotoxum]|uniref:Coiled-coil domain-containing protein 153 n=1 Tax=Dendrobium chrysotoxum TaxID=161865 RepID=A0AAV7G4V3_DENCH|nr:hypothetical protein IEQ34_018550 [Dendrobium chrysotoxum]
MVVRWNSGVRRWSGEEQGLRWWSGEEQGLRWWSGEVQGLRWWSGEVQGLRWWSGEVQGLRWWSGEEQGLRWWSGEVQGLRWWSGEEQDLRWWSDEGPAEQRRQGGPGFKPHGRHGLFCTAARLGPRCGPPGAAPGPLARAAASGLTGRLPGLPGEDPQVLLKKKKLEGVEANTGKVAPIFSPAKIRVPGDVLNRQCVRRHKADDLLSQRTELEAELTGALNEWNAEFVKIKYLQGEFKRKYDQKTREAKIDHLQVDLERAQATITQLREDQRASGEKVAVLEAENKRSQTLIAEKEEARDHIYEVEVKALEQQCLDDGFIRGFLKGVRLMQRKTGVEVEGLTPSQASDDFPPGSDGDEIESELKKSFALEADDEVVDIE